MDEFARKFWQSYDYFLRDKEMRKGQARMNALKRVDPELYEIISGTEFDCFYRDERIPAFDQELFGHNNNSDK